MPTEVFLRRTISGFVPETDEDRENMARVKLGQAIRAKFTVPDERTIGRHKRGFAFLKATFALQDYFESEKIYREWLTIKAGYYDLYVAPDSGLTQFKAKSWSFAKMGEKEFTKLIEDMITAFLNSVVNHGLTVKDIEQAWHQAMDFA